MTTTPTPERWLSNEPGLANLALVPAEPPEPGTGELVVEVKAAALNFSDLLMIDDCYQVRPPRPFTPGQEIAGVVIAAPSGSCCAVGDRVAGKVDWGGFSSHALLRDDMALRLPKNCSFAEGAALPVVYTTVYVGLTESTWVVRDETVLVLAAAGGVGLAAVQIAATRGATVIACAGDDVKCAIAAQNGAHHTLNYRQEGWSKRCKELTGGRGVDIVVDPVGGEATGESLRALGMNGRLLIVGFASGDIPMIPANRLLLKRISAIGVYWNHGSDSEMLARVNQRMMADLANGVIQPQVDIREGLASLPQALSDLQARQTSGKIILDLQVKE
jgi:NADPH:quinone reductase